MTFLLAALLLGPASGAAAPSEVRGLWVVRTGLVSPQAVDDVVEEARRGGFNALFAQVRGRGDAFYGSRLVPRSELLRKQAPDFDPLAYLIARARVQGLQVHAWVNVLLSAGFGTPLAPDHVLVRHPEWMMIPRSAADMALRSAGSDLAAIVERSRGDGEAEGFYLSPSSPGAVLHLEAVVKELVRTYPVDGIHLDFIRYPGPEYDYSRAALEAFAPRRLSGDLANAPSLDPEGWGEYRRRVLDALAQRLSGVARASRPGILVSAAVVPDQSQALYARYQRWPAWMDKGWLDAVCPMTYTPDTRIFRQQVEQARARVGGQAGLWAGVGAYRLALDGILEKIQAAREAGASGVILFSHESLSGGDLDRLRQEAFPGLASQEPAAPAGAHPR